MEEEAVGKISAFREKCKLTTRRTKSPPPAHPQTPHPHPRRHVAHPSCHPERGASPRGSWGHDPGREKRAASEASAWFFPPDGTYPPNLMKLRDDASRLLEKQGNRSHLWETVIFPAEGKLENGKENKREKRKERGGWEGRARQPSLCTAFSSQPRSPSRNTQQQRPDIQSRPRGQAGDARWSMHEVAWTRWTRETLSRAAGQKGSGTK